MLKITKAFLVSLGLLLTLGASLPIEVDARSAWHRRCHGSGNVNCYHCQGTGTNQAGFECNRCNGSGEHKCDRCKGSGVLMSIVKVHKV